LLATEIAQLLADKVLVSSLQGEATLKEGRVMRVTVTGLPADARIINLSRIGSLSGVKDGPWKKICDYLIVHQSDEQDAALFVELKKTLRDGQDGREQLRRSLPILDYLLGICEIHFSTRRPRGKVAYALIGERSSPRLDKQRVRAGQWPRVERYADIKVTTMLGSRVGFSRMLGD